MPHKLLRPKPIMRAKSCPNTIGGKAKTVTESINIAATAATANQNCPVVIVGKVPLRLPVEEWIDAMISSKDAMATNIGDQAMINMATESPVATTVVR